jgi:hypothetical protein
MSNIEWDFIPEEYIWMKIFFPNKSDRNYIEAFILKALVSSGYFGKDIVMPYRYVDNYIDADNIVEKAGDNDLKEKKYKDLEDLGGDDIVKTTDLVCGPDRRMTYLSYQGFNHVLTFDDRNLLWGNYTTDYIETINSPYLKIIANKVLMPGMTLSDADAMSRTMSEAILSRIDNLDEVYDWKIEEFSIDKEDLRLTTLDSEALSSIESSFRSSLKFVTATLGEDVLNIEKEVEKRNIFPSFPERPVDDKFLETHKVQQYINITRWNDDVSDS